MRDDFLTDDWAGEHKRFSSAIAALIDTVLVSLARLHRHDFDAPWKHARQERCG